MFATSIKATLKHSVLKLTKPILGATYVPEALKTATLANTEKFSMETHGAKIPVRVIDVYDGDTIVVAMEVFNKVFAFRVRLAHVNTPEMRPSLNAPDRDSIVARAKLARDFLAKHVMGKIVWLNILGYEKYGRLLAELFISETASETINNLIIEAGLGERYDLKTSNELLMMNDD